MSKSEKQDSPSTPHPGDEGRDVVRRAAHDFNNALTTIRGRAQLLLEEGPDNPAWVSDVEEIGNAARRAEAVVGRLVEWLRLQDDPEG